MKISLVLLITAAFISLSLADEKPAPGIVIANSVPSGKDGKPEQAEKNMENQDNTDNQTGDPLFIESQGLLIDETRSTPGRNFFSAFTQNFNEVMGQRSVITITELVNPIRGSAISITVDDAIVFQAPLNPRQDTTDELAAAAVAAVNDFIINQYSSPADLANLLKPKK